MYFGVWEGVMVGYEFSIQQESDISVKNPMNTNEPIDMKVVLDIEGLLELE